MKTFLWKSSVLAMIFGVATAFSVPCSADEYFKNKSITVQVPSGSGGTYHAYCQIVQRNLGRHIPGDPDMLIQNKPGGAGANSASFMANAAPKNGTVIAMISPGAITVPLWRDVKYDARRFQWLGTLAARSSAIWVWHTHGIRTIADMKNREVTIAAAGFAGGSSLWPRMVKGYLGSNLKLIHGYKGGGALNLAVERGEAMGRWNYRSGFTGVRPTWIPEKKIIPIVAMGPRDAQLDGVPHLRDLLKDGSVNQKVYDVIDMNFQVGQAFYAPPGTSKEALAVLKKAFSDMIADPGTKKVIEERRIEFSPKSAEEIEKLIANGFAAATPEVTEKIRAIYTEKEGS